VAAWAVAAGGRARLVAGRGDDLAGKLLAAAVGERGIELHPATAVAGSSGAMLVVMEAGERTFVADPGANLGLDEGEVVAGLEGAGAVFVSGYPLLRPATRAAAMAAAEAAGRAGVPAVVDAASWPLLTGGAGEPVLAAAALAGALLANRDEAAALAGRRDPADAGTWLAARTGTAVVKCGAAGVLVCDGDRPPLPVPAPATPSPPGTCWPGRPGPPRPRRLGPAPAWLHRRWPPRAPGRRRRVKRGARLCPPCPRPPLPGPGGAEYP
jgi:sugar/nucleoside kinase (ribokinase family)